MDERSLQACQVVYSLRNAQQALGLIRRLSSLSSHSPLRQVRFDNVTLVTFDDVPDVVALECEGVEWHHSVERTARWKLAQASENATARTRAPDSVCELYRAFANAGGDSSAHLAGLSSRCPANDDSAALALITPSTEAKFEGPLVHVRMALQGSLEDVNEDRRDLECAMAALAGSDCELSVSMKASTSKANSTFATALAVATKTEEVTLDFTIAVDNGTEAARVTGLLTEALDSCDQVDDRLQLPEGATCLLAPVVVPGEAAVRHTLESELSSAFDELRVNHTNTDVYFIARSGESPPANLSAGLGPTLSTNLHKVEVVSVENATATELRDIFGRANDERTKNVLGALDELADARARFARAEEHLAEARARGAQLQHKDRESSSA